MDDCVVRALQGTSLGTMQQHGTMQVFPLIGSVGIQPDYLVLKEAMEQGLITVSEVSDAGSVSKLKVENRAKVPILILDGEELAGAKQNRVLNTTILVAALQTMTIPVSCTEHYRWDYRSASFSDSEVSMARKMNAKKMASVSQSLRNERIYHSDQGMVWDDIASMAQESQTHSPTGAMKDIYESMASSLDEYADAFAPVANQTGLMVFINGLPAGLEMLSRPDKYSLIHRKIIRSYATDALLEKKKGNTSIDPAHAARFVERIRECREESFPSPGLGTDLRYEGIGIVGAVLRYEATPIHLSFFTLEENDQVSNEGHMAGYRTRRNHSRRDNVL
jgi:hypothetical protein